MMLYDALLAYFDNTTPVMIKGASYALYNEVLYTLYDAFSDAPGEWRGVCLAHYEARRFPITDIDDYDVDDICEHVSSIMSSRHNMPLTVGRFDGGCFGLWVDVAWYRADPRFRDRINEIMGE